MIEDATHWFDLSDRSTWFCDQALTVPAYRPQDVRFIKNKAKSNDNRMAVEGLQEDGMGLFWVQLDGYAIVDVQGRIAKIVPPTAFVGPSAELRRRFYEDAERVARGALPMVGAGSLREGGDPHEPRL